MTANLPKSFDALLRAAFMAGVHWANPIDTVVDEHVDGPAFEKWRREWAGDPAESEKPSQVDMFLATYGAHPSDIVNSNWPGDEPPIHEHETLPVEKIGDPRFCRCGWRYDPVTAGFYDPEEYKQLTEERAGRRRMFGNAETAEAMNREGL
jgi:hypothetical protein